jgi:predicted transcriptional regulator
MKVSVIMANIVQMIARDDSLYKAAKTMKKYDIGCFLVGAPNYVPAPWPEREDYVWKIDH